jgi:hypothetical protein
LNLLDGPGAGATNAIITLNSLGYYIGRNQGRSEEPHDKNYATIYVSSIGQKHVVDKQF